MYIEIKDNKITSWADWNFEGSKEVDLDFQTFSPDKYEIQNGELVSLENTDKYKEKILNREKQKKIRENEQKREVDFIETTFGKLKTETALGNLKTIAPNLVFMAELNDGIPEGFLKFYSDEDGQLVESKAMNKEQTISLYKEILTAYSTIDSKSIAFTRKIQDAENIEKLENIEICY